MGITCGVPSPLAVAKRATRCVSAKTRSASDRLIGLDRAVEGGLRLALQPLGVAVVARRVVKGLEPLHSGASRQRPGLPRCEMIALERLVSIIIVEQRL